MKKVEIMITKPRDIVQLLVTLVFGPDKENLQGKGVYKNPSMILVAELVACYQLENNG